MGEAEFLFDEALKYTHYSPYEHQRFTTLRNLAKLYKDIDIKSKTLKYYHQALDEHRILTYDRTSPQNAELLNDYTTMLKEWLEFEKHSGLDSNATSKLLAQASGWQQEAAKRSEIELKQKSENEALLNNMADIDFGPYMAALQRKIKGHWSPLPSDCQKQSRVVVDFNVKSNGAVSNIRLHTPSDSFTTNRAATQAVALSAPFARLPKNAPESVDIQFTFDMTPFFYPKCQIKPSAKRTKH